MLFWGCVILLQVLVYCRRPASSIAEEVAHVPQERSEVFPCTNTPFLPSQSDTKQVQVVVSIAEEMEELVQGVDRRESDLNEVRICRG